MDPSPCFSDVYSSLPGHPLLGSLPELATRCAHGSQPWTSPIDCLPQRVTGEARMRKVRTGVEGEKKRSLRCAKAETQGGYLAQGASASEEQKTQTQMCLKEKPVLFCSSSASTPNRASDSLTLREQNQQPPPPAPHSWAPEEKTHSAI